ncbi:hypothetical protein CDAR_306671 [Caerostris darwini]|uniref:Uncharacterized protein n=1 Tax=Caerostris darwini TaxID=1538125 RepID=A0AAV4SF74_9ARAC|nr:hypothetical protein CDAR_306671 [Caerostris darwini]
MENSFNILKASSHPAARITGPPVKILLVGDPSCRNGELINMFLRTKESTVHKRMFAKVYVHQMPDKNVTLFVFDVIDEDYFQQRDHIFYGDTVVLFCYDADDPITLRNLLHFWIPKFWFQTVAGVPCILVESGKKLDERNCDVLAAELMSKERSEILKLYRFDTVIECSVDDPKSIDCLFNTAIRIALNTYYVI